MKVKVLNQKGKETTNTIELSKEVFDVEVKKEVLSQYVYSYLSNQRESNAHTKDRSEVSGGGKKPWRQKGTGRARFGSSRNPIWRKGGVAFGPRNDRNWKKNMTKNFKKAAFRNAISLAFDKDMLKVVEQLEIKKDSPLTKQGVEFRNNFNKPRKMMIVLGEVNKDVMNLFSNVKEVKVTHVGEVNTYDILNGGVVILDEAAVKLLNEKYSK